MFFISVNGQQIYKPLDDLLVIFNPKLTLEIGKAGALEFDIPPANPFYDKLQQLTTEVTVEMDDDEIFHGRVLSSERAFNNIRHVYCEGDLSYLIDSVQKGEQFVGTTHQLFNKIISNHNARVDANKRFIVGTVNIENRQVIITGKTNSENINVGAIDYKQIAIDSIADEWNNSFDYIQNCLIDYCGGYLRTRRVNGTMYIDLLADFNTEASQPIQLGRNLLDLTEEISVEDLFTVLIPLGDDNLTIAAVNGGSDEIVDSAAVAKYGRIVKTHVFSNVNNPSTLLENARRFLATSINVPRTITVRAVDLHLINQNIDAIKIGDHVDIISFVHDVSDSLMCTKIEYDLDRPENNNYTFGNPKQTLTQRYREDARQNSNNSTNPSSASAAGASAAAAAAKETAKESDKALKDFYDAWINVDKDQGHIDLGALYKKYIDGKQVLISQCGIDLDGATGNVNIKSLHNVVDEHGRQIANNEAKISIVETDTKVAIQNVTNRTEHLAGVEASHYTEIKQESSILGSSIEAVVRDVNTIDNRTTNAVAALTQRADDQEARITQSVAYFDTLASQTTSRVASIELWATSAESAIALKADKVYVDGQFNAAVGVIEDLTSGRTIASKIRATDILAGSISLFSEGGAVPVASMNHSHTFAFIEQTNGDITLSLAGATNTIPQQNSFNIADTKYYKDNVSAVKLESLAYYELSGEQTVTYNADTKTLSASVQATLSNGNENGSIRTVSIPADLAYEAGFEDGGGSSSEVYTTGIAYYTVSGEDTVSYDANAKELHASVQATLSNGNTRGSIRTVSIPADLAYDAGFTDGTQSGSGDVYTTGIAYYRVSGEDTVSYDADTKTLNASVQATLSNSNTRGSIRTVSIPATLAYNAGKADAESGAASEVYTTGISYYTVSGEQTVSYNADTTTLSASVQATLSNGNTRGSVRTVTIPAGLAVQAGIDSVSIKTLDFYSGWSEDSRGYLYETANRRFKVRIKGTLSDNANNRVYASTVYLPATEAYEAGQDSVTVSTTLTASSGAASNVAKVTSTTTASNLDNPISKVVNLNLFVKENTSERVVVTISDSDNNELATRTIIPQSSSVSISSVNITRKSYNDYYWTGSAWHIPVMVYIYFSDGTQTSYDDDISVQDVVNAAQSSGSCSGHVEVRGISGNSAFIKIYDSSWNAVAVGSSVNGKWIDSMTSETFG